MEAMRIQKWLSQLGIASRREAETWIAEGRVAVNGKVVRELGTKVTPGVDEVTVDGENVGESAPSRVYWLMNKPDNCLTVVGDEFERPTIYDVTKLRTVRFRVYPIGRLDYRTEGLLLLTNDGDLLNHMGKKGAAYQRQYHVLLSGRLDPEVEDKIRKGEIKLEDGPVGKAEIRFAHGHELGASRGSWYVLTLNESRNRLVRRIFEHFNLKVVRMIRVAFAGLELDEDLKPGEYRQLSPDEIRELKRTVGMKRASPAKAAAPSE